MRENNDAIKELTGCIVQYYKPERIILFGSGAVGKVTKNSDLDFVIVKDTNARFYDRIGEVLKLVRNIYPKFPLDILVYTPAEYEEMKATNPFFREEIIAKGEVLYEH